MITITMVKPYSSLYFLLRYEHPVAIKIQQGEVLLRSEGDWYQIGRWEPPYVRVSRTWAWVLSNPERMPASPGRRKYIYWKGEMRHFCLMRGLRLRFS